MTDSMQQMALNTLGAYFGYTSFRPGQDRMVDAILAGRDALGVMPTGAERVERHLLHAIGHGFLTSKSSAADYTPPRGPLPHGCQPRSFCGQSLGTFLND